MTIDDCKILDRKALGSIQLCLELSTTFKITKVKMIKELMETLVKLYEKLDTSNKVFLMKFLFNIKMVEGGFVKNHLNEFTMVTSQLAFVDINFDE